jgi:amidase
VEQQWLGAEQARDLIASGEISSVELTQALIERVRAIDAPGTATALRSVLALNPHALDEAAAADAGQTQGALRGVPVLVKDNIDCVGLPGTAGSSALAGRKIAVDAPLVARLRAAGAVILGASNLSEWANIRSSTSTSGWSAVGGLVRNPWGLQRSAGGSSSGSGAAVAAGLAPLAVGTETDGSITCPASLNGVVGIKPTVGTVSTERVIPISSSQDSPGPLARSVADAALMLEVLSGRSG